MQAHPNIANAVELAVGAFGLRIVSKSPFLMARFTNLTGLDHNITEAAVLLTAPDLRTRGFLSLFRRRTPQKIIFAAKSGLWWAVWDNENIRIDGSPSFHISTAEYIPSKNRA